MFSQEVSYSNISDVYEKLLLMSCWTLVRVDIFFCDKLNNFLYIYVKLIDYKVNGNNSFADKKNENNSFCMLLGSAWDFIGAEIWMYWD